MVAVIVGVFLLAIKYEKPLDQRSYRVIRRLLALGAFLDALICLMSGYCTMRGWDPLVLDQHLVPVLFNLQLSIMAYAMMGILHLRHIK